MYGSVTYLQSMEDVMYHNLYAWCSNDVSCVARRALRASVRCVLRSCVLVMILLRLSITTIKYSPCSSPLLVGLTKRAMSSHVVCDTQTLLAPLHNHSKLLSFSNLSISSSCTFIHGIPSSPHKILIYATGWTIHKQATL